MMLDLEKLLDAIRMQESGGNQNAVSPAGARTAYGIMPATAADPGYGVKPADINALTKDETAARNFSRDYLTAMYNKTGNWNAALAAYNGGLGRGLAYNKGGILPTETANYVPSVMKRYNSAVTPSAPTPARQRFDSIVAQKNGSAQPMTVGSPQDMTDGLDTSAVNTGGMDAIKDPTMKGMFLQGGGTGVQVQAQPPMDITPSASGSTLGPDPDSDPNAEPDANADEKPGFFKRALGGIGSENGGGLFGLSPGTKQALLRFGAGLAGGASKGWGAGIGAGFAGAADALDTQRERDLLQQKLDFSQLGVKAAYTAIKQKLEADGDPQAASKALILATNPDAAKAAGMSLDTNFGWTRDKNGKLIPEENGPADPAYQKKLSEAKMVGSEIDDETADNVARQWLSGDEHALMYWGRGNTGAANVMKIRQRAFQVGKDEFHMSPADISAKTAEFQGMKAGQVTIAKRAAQADLAAREALKIIPTVRSASASVPRSQFPALNTILEAGMKHTGDTKVVQLGVALNSLVNIYARAINPTGVSTEGDKAHARELLDKAWADGQINAAVDQMEIEMNAALTSAGDAKKALTKSYVGSESDNSGSGITIEEVK